ncbi:MAG TPA: hypothetical protein VH231_05215 [Solirubrobacteraceae bacterium]|nr:hypothetical protein [Solirubrobacteraceae bacterium]
MDPPGVRSFLATPNSGTALTEFNAQTPASGPFGITGGADGNVWFTEKNVAKLGKVTPNGTTSDFAVPGGMAPYDIISGGPDLLWMTDQSAGALYKITGLNNPKPTIVAQSVALANPTGLALGPDGDVWVDQMAGSVQRVKPDGSADGAAIPTGGTNLQSIAKSTDNALLWVTDLHDGPGGNNGLIKITTDAVHTATPVRIGAGKGPRGVTAASDGRIYFAESSGVAGEKIGRVNADGSNPQESSALTGGASDPEGVAFGPDGNLYVAIFNTAQVGQVAPGLGPITQFKPGISGTMGPREIAMGADKNLWFTNETNNKVGRLTVDPPPTPAPPNNGGGSSSSGGGTTANTSGATTPVLPVLPAGNGASPHVSSLSVSPSRSRVGPQATAVAAASGATGTTITYRLSKAANVTLQFQQPLPGRRKGSRCVAPSRSLRKARRCTRLSPKGTLTRTGQQGTNSVAFSGRIGRKALKPAKYEVAITATDSAGQTSAVSTASFTVLPPKRVKSKKN